ncbi:hypothetical protein [Yoonia sp.]|jgi:hypothetical protein|uniref:hypothetical protein n=1 Tax=Yoonia sp. TaxID=2212373 RepID=UPI0025E26508|nr:hypothetical protein [Yoonia sp.]
MTRQLRDATDTDARLQFGGLTALNRVCKLLRKADAVDRWLWQQKGVLLAEFGLTCP